MTWPSASSARSVANDPLASTGTLGEPLRQRARRRPHASRLGVWKNHGPATVYGDATDRDDR